ncbi:Seven TM Receptor [Caenorhabditis elegans]|uniref:Seven TM Receptor n=1 Tax=Caenorhabditis elegans TaxID=6239 RepID=O61983_CAEEL|nr:Seven TM Receptor [Caenorhabditis elegans]CCD67032.2 Seven TM Receptor [Caenorhabditis elegans]|eukprot:NP_503438.2 Seven TM Receptor [Caenorhabditis elegans]
MDILTKIVPLTQTTCGILSFLIHGVLIEMVLFRSPVGIGMYKYLMVYISVFELIFATLDLIVQPEFFSYSSVYLVIARTDRWNLPVAFTMTSNAMFCSMFGMSMAMFTLHFIYRYCVIIGSNFVKMDSNFKFCVWFLTPILYGSIWPVIIFTTLVPSLSTDMLLLKHYLHDRNLTLNQITYIGPNYYIFDSKGIEVLNVTVCAGMFVIVMMVLISIITIVIFAYKCYLGVGKLLRESNHSEGYKKLQSQLLNMLLAQVCIPAVLMHIPASLQLITPFLHYGNEVGSALFCIGVAVYPVLDPLPTLLMIQHYRQALGSIIAKSFKFQF